MRHASAGLVLVALALLSMHRVPDWHDDYSLWMAASRVASSPRIWINLGRANALTGRHVAAFQCYQRAYALATGRWDARKIQATALANLAVLWHERGQDPTALHVLHLAEQKGLSDRMVITFRGYFLRTCGGRCADIS